LAKPSSRYTLFPKEAGMALQRVDISRFDLEGAGNEQGSVFGLPYDEHESNVVLLPVPWEPTTSYGRGTAGGPQAIVEASPQLDLLDLELAELGLSQPWAYGIHMVEPDPEIALWNEEACRLARPILDRGGRIDDNPTLLEARDRVNALSQAMVDRIHEAVARRLAAGKLVGVVGGDHAVAEGTIMAHAEHFAARAPKEALGILHIDAHADLRVAYEGFERSHASVMHNVVKRLPTLEALVQVGLRDVSEGEYARCLADPRLVPVFDHELRRRLDGGESWRRICDAICDALPKHVYVSFDIDGLDPTFCPGTGTPVPGGLSYGQAMSLLVHLGRRDKRVIGFDLVEVAPSPTRPQWDGNVGARLLYRLAALALLGAGARDDGSRKTRPNAMPKTMPKTML
jgi:agmatinase